MKVSIITVSYNSEATIEDTIHSVLKQTYSNIEYIIIDGDSSDGTLDIVRKHDDRIATVVSEKDKGIYDAMNKGIEQATGDVIGILNSDDFYASPTIIEQVVDAFHKTGCDALYGDLVYVNQNQVEKVARYWKAGAYKPGAFKRGWMPPHPTFFVRADKYRELGGYNLELKSAADYELMLRFIHKHEIEVAYLPEVMIKMRVGGQSNQSLMNRLKANREDKKAWDINGLKPAPYTFIAKPVSKISQFWKRRNID